MTNNMICPINGIMTSIVVVAVMSTIAYVEIN